MPRIDDNILDCSIYLYPSIQEAQGGEKSGGSGFLVSVPSETSKGRGYVYAVTNSHVIREAGSPIIRLNTKEGAMEILPIDERAWVHHPDGDDLAICQLRINTEKYRVKYLPISMFMSQEIIAKEKIGAGDEVFMVGRFIGYDGKQQNTPTVRFGNIAIGTVQPMPHPRGYLTDSFLIETRSLSGYSGSPVFVHILPFSKRPEMEGWSAQRGPWLLGVDWGHEHFFEKVLEQDGTETQEKRKVRTNSGITNVVPVWKLLELLNIKEFAEMRKREDERMAEEQKKKVSGVTLDSSDSEILTKARFHKILDKASQPIKKSEKEKS